MADLFSPILDYSLWFSSLATKHNLSSACVNDVLNFVHTFHSDSNSSIGINRKNLDHRIGIQSIPAKLHYSCVTCNALTTADLYSRQVPSCCGKKLNCATETFFTFSTIDMLKLRLPQIEWRSEKHYESALLKLRNVKIRENDITLTINTDGAPVFKSSNMSLWPLLAIINEAKRNKRNDVILCGLWAGKKPNMDHFLSPLLDEMKTLCQDGINWTKKDGTVVTSRVYVLNVLCDSVARPVVQKMTQFNGKYGCNYCYYETPGKFFPNRVAKIRTHSTHEKDVMNLLSGNCATHKGVKGLSPLSKLPYFDLIEGTNLNLLLNNSYMTSCSCCLRTN